MLDEYLRKNEFLDYSAKHWTTHFHESKTGLDQTAPEFRANEPETQSILRLCDANSKRCLTWFRIYWTTMTKDFPGTFTTMMIASYFGLTATVIRLLEIDIDQDIDLDSKDDVYERSAQSSIYCLSGHHGITELVSKKGIKLNLYLEEDKLTALLFSATSMGHETAVSLVLKAGKVDPDSKDEKEQTPLSHAAKNCHEDHTGRTPLSYAAENGYEAIVKLLLETKKVDLDSMTDDGRTPLINATMHGHKAIVELLLETGKVDVNRADNYNMTSLFYAAKYGRGAVIRALSKTGKVDVNSSSSEGRTPLSYAVRGNHAAAVQVLLDVGADPNLEMNPVSLGLDRLPLAQAVWDGHIEIVKLLLENGAQPDLKDNRGNILLLWALSHSRTLVPEIYKLLKSYRTRMPNPEQV
ncbi:uncharacterized protein DFL_006960 [Arthrobotrys flagrans]|nr:hypothetical protein DFL_006960 [Arthrobotrys flagrans]